MRRLILIFTLLPLFNRVLHADDRSYKILSTDIQTYINKDGNVDFIETREFSFNGEFSFVYQDILKSGYDKIYDIQVFEDEVMYLNTETKETRTFLIDERKNFYRIYLYHKSSDETKKFTIKYTLLNPFRIGENESQLYWIYLSDEWDKSPGALSISQKFSGEINQNDIVYDLEKPSNSKKYELQIDDSSFDLYSSSFTKNTEMKLRTIFPTSFFTNPKINDSDFSLAAFERGIKNKKLARYFIVPLTAISLFSFVGFARRNLTTFKIDIDKNHIFTSYPSEDHPAVINGLIYRALSLGPSGGGVLSTLFELASLKKIYIEAIGENKWYKSKQLKVTIHSTEDHDVESSFAKLLLKRLQKFGPETFFKDIYSDISSYASEWTSLKKDAINSNGWVDTSYRDEKKRSAIMHFLILFFIIFCAFWFETMVGLLAIAPLFFFIVTIAGSRLTKEGQLLYNQWGLFIHQLSENKIKVEHFEPDRLLQYCLALGVQPESLKSIINNIESKHDDSFVWLYAGGYTNASSMATIVSDIAATGTTVSAAYGGDGGGGAGGGGAGGGGGGGAG